MFSPTSLANFLACQHLTALDRAETAGQIRKPFFADPGLDLLVKLGLAHEEKYLRYLSEEQNLQVTRIAKEASWKDAAAETVAAIRDGAQAIYQAAFGSQQWYGRADFLLRVEKPGDQNGWSYEVVETKLARSTKARAIIQLSFYSDLLSEIQGVTPTHMHVVLGNGAQPETFSVHRYLAYFRKVQREFENANKILAQTYPEPVDHCRVCGWFTNCDDLWRSDDHLSLVAGISRNQRKRLVACGIKTVHELAGLQPGPIEGIGTQALTSIREQARLQVQGGDEGRYLHELFVPPEINRGLCALPPPSPGDIFLDFEGDAFAFEEGLEYLFGVLTLGNDNNAAPAYTPTWALNRADERVAFERFITDVCQRRREYPDMHIYHYGAYEETAIKRMTGRHATCADEVDEMLRAEIFVDLYRVVRQALRASVESYSLKKIEPLYEFKRDVPLVEANLARNTLQAVLAFGQTGEDFSEIQKQIEGYNRDDCISALRLRDWLEERRLELEATQGPLPRPELKAGEADEDLSAYLERVREVEARLTADIPVEETERSEEQKAKWLLAQLLEWHRREDKSAWWKYFELCKLRDEEFQQDKIALGGLVYEGVVAQVKRSLVHRYRFPFQDHAIDRAPSVHDPKTQSGVGEIVEIDERALTIDIKRSASSTAPHPTALIPHDIIKATVLRESLLQLGAWVADNGIDVPGPFKAARELLLRKSPRLRQGTLHEIATDDQETVAVAKKVAVALDETVLPIQGPPGAGKTYTGARMIVELVNSGLRVGITGVSHKVISKLLKDTCEAAKEAGVNFAAIQRVDTDDGCEDGLVTRAKNNDAVVKALDERKAQVIAGTVWLWARPKLNDTVDVLFVDEAGQMSLANVLAASPAARSIVLLGDPQQLDQPKRGVHPPGADASALSHLLNGRTTIGEDQGLFLAESWRLHPDVCAFTSELFYDKRLTTRPENATQRLNTEGPFGGTGLRFVSVAHAGNQSESPEEADAVGNIVEGLLRNGTTWTNKKGAIVPLTLNDILVVAPYNAQVSTLAQRLPAGARIGTVDKFQGQEAPVVIYSMATSTPEDAPRGMEFLYSSNRLNVATSRAQCLTVLVASPELFEVQCKTPRQIELANSFCRYLEMAAAV